MENDSLIPWTINIQLTYLDSETSIQKIVEAIAYYC